MFCECLTERRYPQATRETQLSSSILTLRIPVMWKAHASFREMLSRDPRKLFSLQLLESSHSLFITQPLQVNPTINTWYNRLNKIIIKCGTELEPTKTHSCKLQLYNLPLWLFCDKTPKTDFRLKCEFGNRGKTHSHLI